MYPQPKMVTENSHLAGRYGRADAIALGKGLFGCLGCGRAGLVLNDRFLVADCNVVLDDRHPSVVLTNYINARRQLSSLWHTADTG